MSSVMGEVSDRTAASSPRQAAICARSRLPCEPGGDGRSKDILRISQDEFRFGIIGNTKFKSF